MIQILERNLYAFAVMWLMLGDQGVFEIKATETVAVFDIEEDAYAWVCESIPGYESGIGGTAVDGETEVCNGYSSRK